MSRGYAPDPRRSLALARVRARIKTLVAPIRMSNVVINRSGLPSYVPVCQAGLSSSEVLNSARTTLLSIFTCLPAGQIVSTNLPFC